MSKRKSGHPSRVNGSGKGNTAPHFSASSSSAPNKKHKAAVRAKKKDDVTIYRGSKLFRMRLSTSTRVLCM
jgi:hypothetical protein